MLVLTSSVTGEKYIIERIDIHEAGIIIVWVWEEARCMREPLYKKAFEEGSLPVRESLRPDGNGHPIEIIVDPSKSLKDYYKEILRKIEAYIDGGREDEY